MSSNWCEVRTQIFFFFDLFFNILMLWAKCMPIDFEFQQGFFTSSLTARPSVYLSHFILSDLHYGLYHYT